MAAPERLPSPLAVDAAVYNDVPSRTLMVRLSESAGGYEQSLWREAHGALSREHDRGTAASTVWVSVPGGRNVVYAEPGDYGVLLCHFPVGKAGYAAAVDKPNLYALVTLDRSSARFLAVRFLHRG
jgi:hypothetical protein